MYTNKIKMLLEVLSDWISMCISIRTLEVFYFPYSFMSFLLCRDGGELSTRDLQKMVQALPQYSEQIEKLSLHVDVSKTYMAALHSDKLN